MAARKKVKKKTTKKVFELTWVFENFEEHPTFYTKRMFGGLTAYVHHRMMAMIAEDPGNRSYKDIACDFDIWNGAFYPTYYEHHESLQKEFPNLIQHPIIKKWLYLPLESESFEETVHECAVYIRRNDPRFGIHPQNSAPTKKKKKAKKKTSSEKSTKKKNTKKKVNKKKVKKSS